MDEVIPQQGSIRRSSSSLLPALRANAGEARKGEGWPITFRHLGKAGYELTLYAANQAARQKWLEFIDTAQGKVRARGDFLNINVLSCGFFAASNKVNCVAPFGRWKHAHHPGVRPSANEKKKFRWRPQTHLWYGQWHLLVGPQVQG
jgi:hypothetical protein